MSRCRIGFFAALALALGFSGSAAIATDLTIGADGRMTLELIGSDAGFRNTLSVFDPDVLIASTGCKLEPALGLSGVHSVSEKRSQRGCRVSLDGDPATPGIQGFLSGTTFEFNLCAQTDADPECEFVWSSNPALNPDGFDHVRTTELFPVDQPGRVFRLEWEDLENGGDQDFNDLIAVVRVEQDSDGDGLWDDWEQFGVDTTGDGIVDLDLPALGANPLRKDLFLEIDWMDCALAGSDCPAGGLHSHQPDPVAVAAVVQAFANANVINPDGSVGITLHVDVSNAIPHQEFLVLPGGCFPGAPGTGFDAVKNAPANFGPNNPRRFAYHYALFTHRQTSGDGGSSGCGELPGNDFQVSLGDFPGRVGTIMHQAGTLLHEFGHNLNLLHGGGTGINNKPNYLSLMSYTYQLTGIPPMDPDGAGPLTGRIDFSRSALPSLDESSLSEPAGIGDGIDTAFYRCPGGALAMRAGNLPIDWNCNGSTVDLGVASDVNGDGARNLLGGYWDWNNLKYDFQTTFNFEDGFHSPIEEPELDHATYQETIAADLAISQVAAPGVVLTGSNVTYTITVLNKRPEAATDVLVEVLLPATTTFVSCASTAGGVCGGAGNARTVTFATLGGGSSATIVLVANVSCPVRDGASITNTAHVSFSMPDPDPSDNSAATTVTAANPAPVIAGAGASPSSLWPPNHQMVDIGIGYSVTDNCGVPTCGLAVTANEPLDGPGDGRTVPDWEILDAHHARLRAERSGTGAGRLYTVTITCTDGAGPPASRAVTVAVPRSRK